MEIKLYDNLQTFEIHHLDDFNNQNESSYLTYLDILHKGYDKYLDVYFNNSVKKINEVNIAFENRVDAETIANTTIEVKEKLYSIVSNVLEILKFIQLEKERQKTTIKLKISNNIQPVEIDEPPLTDKQIEKIGLFVRAGIIEFLREKNKDNNLNQSQIAKFLKELTSEPLKNSESIRPHLTDDLTSSKHPFYTNGRKDDLDLILKKYNIIPQSEK